MHTVCLSPFVHSLRESLLDAKMDRSISVLTDCVGCLVDGFIERLLEPNTV